MYGILSIIKAALFVFVYFLLCTYFDNSFDLNKIDPYYFYAAVTISFVLGLFIIVQSNETNSVVRTLSGQVLDIDRMLLKQQGRSTVRVGFHASRLVYFLISIYIFSYWFDVMSPQIPTYMYIPEFHKIAPYWIATIYGVFSLKVMFGRKFDLEEV